MKVKYHTGVSLVFSWWIFATYKSWEFALASLAAGIIIDIDHFFDYVMEYGLDFELDLFYRSSYEGLYKRAYLFFHGWEWALFLAIATLASNFWEPLLGALCGYMLHMLTDQIFNQPTPFAYSLVWRWQRKFKYKDCFPHD